MASYLERFGFIKPVPVKQHSVKTCCAKCKGSSCKDEVLEPKTENEFTQKDEPVDLGFTLKEFN